MIQLFYFVLDLIIHRRIIFVKPSICHDPIFFNNGNIAFRMSSFYGTFTRLCHLQFASEGNAFQIALRGSLEKHLKRQRLPSDHSSLTQSTLFLCWVSHFSLINNISESLVVIFVINGTKKLCTANSRLLPYLHQRQHSRTTPWI